MCHQTQMHKLITPGLKDTEGQKVTWNIIKLIRLTTEQSTFYFYKTIHNGEEIEVDLFKRFWSDPPEHCFLQLSQWRVIVYQWVPIREQKFADLISLCRMQIIPPVYHPCYLLIPHDTDLISSARVLKRYIWRHPNIFQIKTYLKTICSYIKVSILFSGSLTQVDHTTLF